MLRMTTSKTDYYDIEVIGKQGGIKIAVRSGPLDRVPPQYAWLILSLFWHRCRRLLISDQLCRMLATPVTQENVEKRFVKEHSFWRLLLEYTTFTCTRSSLIPVYEEFGPDCPAIFRALTLQSTSTTALYCQASLSPQCPSTHPAPQSIQRLRRI